MRVAVLIHANKDREGGALSSREHIAEMGKFNEELIKAGIMLAAEGLKPSRDGVWFKFGGAKKSTVVDGPFAETKELIAGIWLWQVKSMDEAKEWLKRAPFQDGDVVEIRPVSDLADLGDAVTPEHREAQERFRAAQKR